MRSRLIMTLCAVFMLSSAAFPAVPASITVQGKLTDSTGVALPAGPKTFTFHIFRSDGTLLWPSMAGEVQSITSGADGLWVGLLGAISPLYDAVFSDTSAWLEIDVDETTLPRVRLVTGPYAFRVATVDGATGGTITSKVSIGPGHTNTGLHAFVVGDSNTVSGNYGAVGGGLHDTASNDYSTVCGGTRNFAGSYSSTIGGGSFNRATGANATVAGGQNNAASGIYSCVPGGGYNQAVGNASLAAGFAAKANHSASFVWNSGVSSADSFGTSANNQFLVRASGGVGIGTNAPEAPLHVFESSAGSVTANTSSIAAFERGGNGYLSVLTPDANERGILFGEPSDPSAGGIVYNNGSTLDGLQFRTNGNSTKMVLDSLGRVGIGINTPEATLHVMDVNVAGISGNPNASAVFERNGENWIHMLTPDGQQCGILFGISGNSLMGSIRFNAGNNRGFDFRASDNNSRLILDSLGNLTADGCVVGSNIACPSDARFKRDIETLPDALQKVGKLRGVQYQWKTDEFPDREFPGGEQIGLVAQEVLEVAPQAVVKQPDGYLAVDYARLVPLLIESIKEQQEHIEALEKKLDQLTP